MSNPLAAQPVQLTILPTDFGADDTAYFATCVCGWVDEEDSDTKALANGRALAIHGHDSQGA